ncbi:hypothetical protein WJX72_006884 [[Myrmecia] bisecta]|uniref:Uncharacterized protein n=1 Tax=[Myrmecia] bisecta TaxID=41462 RepID=A0AAW1PX50_9CHLO
MVGRLSKTVSLLSRTRQVHTIPGVKGVNYFPSLSKVEPQTTQLVDPVEKAVDAAFWTAEEASSICTEHGRLPRGVYVPEGGRKIATPDMPDPLRHSLVEPSYTAGRAQQTQ